MYHFHMFMEKFGLIILITFESRKHQLLRLLIKDSIYKSECYSENISVTILTSKTIII